MGKTFKKNTAARAAARIFLAEEEKKGSIEVFLRSDKYTPGTACSHFFPELGGQGSISMDGFSACRLGRPVRKIEEELE